MISEQKIPQEGTQQKTGWLRYLLIAVILEKIVQHIFVTLWFAFNSYGIRSTVAVNPDVLMVLGAVIAVLFLLSLWGMVARQSWTINLLTALALFDIVGEFVAQGKLGITLNVSFMVATLLLILTFVYRRVKVGSEISR